MSKELTKADLQAQVAAHNEAREAEVAEVLDTHQHDPDGWVDEEIYKSEFIQNMTSSLAVQERFNAEGLKVKHMRATPMAWVHNLLYLNGAKFDFTGREYLAPIYNSNHQRLLLKTGRQVEKSSQLANKLVINSIIRPFFKSLYVSPSHMQTRQFSNEKLKPLMEMSPLIAKYMLNHNVSSQVFEKGFANASMIFLRSCFLTADRARGISADQCAIDELQDMLISNVPVILECLSHSKYKYQLFAGTPKTFENTIEVYWQHSSQNEWMVPCDCKGGDGGRFWNFLDTANISYEKGVVCRNCGKRIPVTEGQWASANPGAAIAGYRIPQLMVPWIIHQRRDWDELVHKRKTYSEAQFANEVLGLSYDNANKPITRAEVMACCADYDMWDNPFTPQVQAEARRHILFAGVDWGEGRDGGKTPTGKVASASYTVLTIVSYHGKRLKLHYAKKYMGKETDPNFIVQELVRLVKFLGIRRIGVDWGHGWGVNNQIVRALGIQNVIQYQHVDSLRERRKWDGRGAKFELQRNLIMSELFFWMKNQDVMFPRWDHLQPFAMDILAIFAEYCEYQRKLRFDHKSSEPDDFFHSLLYAWQTANIYFGRED